MPVTRYLSRIWTDEFEDRRPSLYPIDKLEMTKADIVNRVATATGVTKLETEILVDGFFKTMADALASGDHIEIRGFGTFRTKKRSPRMARNPRTGEAVALGEHFVPTFKPSRELRQLIDDRQKRVTSPLSRTTK